MARSHRSLRKTELPQVFDPFMVAKEKHRIVFWRRCEVEEMCPICLTQMKGKSVSVYPCGHFVHNRCNKDLQESTCRSKNRCPMCRQPLSHKDESDDPSVHILLELPEADFSVILESVRAFLV